MHGDVCPNCPRYWAYHIIRNIPSILIARVRLLNDDLYMMITTIYDSMTLTGDAVYSPHPQGMNPLRNAARALANLPMCSLAEWNLADVNHSFDMF